MTETGTNLGPLTTTFIPPPECTVAIAQCSTCLHAWAGQECARSPAGPQDGTQCWPGTSSGVPAPEAPFLGWGFYSPGNACPAGHTSACSATAGQRGGFPFQFSLVGAETAVGCCPGGFTCTLDGAGYQTCAVDTESDVALATANCNVRNGLLGEVQTVLLAAGGVTLSAVAPLIQINFQSSDLPTSSSTSTLSSSTTASSEPVETGSGSSSGISTGAIAGIAIAVVVLVLAVMGAAFFVWRKKRRIQLGGEKMHAGYHTVSPGSGGGGGGEYHTTLATHPQAGHELDPRQDGVAMNASPGYSSYSGGRGQDGKYYYSCQIVEADGTPVQPRLEASGAEIQPRELPA